MAALILGQLIHLLWPAFPSWALSLLSQLVPFVIDLTRKLDLDPELRVLKGREKLIYVATASEKFIDDHGDNLPGWHDLPEEQRDRILRSMVEVLLWVDRLGRRQGEVRDATPLFAKPKAKKRA